MIWMVTLTYWSIIDVPEGSNVDSSFVECDPVSPFLHMMFQKLCVSIAGSRSVFILLPDLVSIEADEENTSPIADAGGDQEVDLQGSFILLVAFLVLKPKLSWMVLHLMIPMVTT